jgi:hypothetical protein
MEGAFAGLFRRRAWHWISAMYFDCAGQHRVSAAHANLRARSFRISGQAGSRRWRDCLGVVPAQTPVPGQAHVSIEAAKAKAERSVPSNCRIFTASRKKAMCRGWMQPSIIKQSSSLIEYADYFSR